ncbi:MAG: metal ABC transporter substrate-binding protein, partial [Vicinamibacteria bacterium]
MKRFARTRRPELLYSAAAAFAATLLPVLFRCGPASPPGDIVVSIFPLEQIAREIVGDRLRIETLLPPGASPHTFEPRPGDVARTEQARLFVRIGGGFDDWAENLLGAANPKRTTLSLLEARRPDLRGRNSTDPHIWL